MKVDTEKIRESLKQCMDPEIPISIVDMGLIYNIDVSDNNDVNIRMTMTTQGCPLHDTLIHDVTRYTKKVYGVNQVKIDIVWDPTWSIDMMSENGKAILKNMSMQNVNPISVNYDIAMPQGVGKLIKQEDGSLVLSNGHKQGFMVNQHIIDFWKLCNGERKITELVDIFSQKKGLKRTHVEKEVMQLINQLREGGLIIINQNELPNVKFKNSST